MEVFTYSIIIFCMIPGMDNTGNPKQMPWIDNLIRCIQNDNKEHQILILSQENNEFHRIENMVQTISRQIPSLVFSAQEITSNEHLESNSPLISNIRTTLIIIIHFPKIGKNASQLYQMVEFASNLSGARTRPRCLILLPEEYDLLSHDDLLHHMWTKRFLDATILEFPKMELKEGNYSSMMQTPLVRHYNPFTNTYNRYEYSEMVSWFPDKIRKLNGYELKVGLIEVSPFVLLEHDSTGHLNKAYGLDVLMTEELAKAMDFRIAWDAPIEESGWGSSIDCTKENSTGLIYKLMNNELDFMGFENGRYDACYEGLYEHSRGTKFAKVAIVVPIFRISSNRSFTYWNILKGVFFVSLFLIPWFISYKMLGKPPSLNILQLVRIVLGTTTPEEPQKLTERMVYASILISCMLQASFIYSVITEDSLQMNTKPELKNVKDVVSSDLSPVIGSDYYSAFYNHTDGYTRLLLEKSDRKMNIGDCLTQLISKKNVVCITRSEVAQSRMEDNKDTCGRPVMKVLDEVLRFTISGMNMEAGSPYVRRFDDIIQSLIESGIVKLWHRIRFGRSPVVIDSEEPCSQAGSEETHLMPRIIYLFTVGYTCATIAFLGELLLAHFVK